MAETTGPNGHDANPPAESRILSLDSVRRPIGKAGDYITRQQAAEMVAKALAEEVPKVHEFYLNQVPNFIARMIQDALLHYQLIKPVEPVDIAPKPEGEGEAVAAESNAAAPDSASVDAGSSTSDPETARPAALGRADRPTVPEMVSLVHAYRDMPGNSVGGNLHIVLDDENVEDSSVEFCRKQAEEAGDVEGVKLAQLIALMTTTQRKALARRFYEGSFDDTRGSA